MNENAPKFPTFLKVDFYLGVCFVVVGFYLYRVSSANLFFDVSMGEWELRAT